MARNCKLRSAAKTQCNTEQRDFSHRGEYPTSKSAKLITSITSFRGKSLAAHHFRESPVSVSEPEKRSYSRLVAALMTLAMGGGVLASNLIGSEKIYSRSANDMNALFLPSPTRTGHVDIASFAPMNLHKYGPRRETAQERGSSSIHHQLYEKKLV